MEETSQSRSAAARQVPDQQSDPPAAQGAGRWIAILAGSLAVLLGALDTYVVVTVMTDIMAGVGIPLNKIQNATPIVTAYLLGYIAAMPLLGRLSDRIGRRLVLQLSLGGFIVGSIVTALAHDMPTILAGRVVQGVASGALLPVTLALGADLWSRRNRAAVLGGIGAAQELGSVLGPLYGVAIVWLLGSWRDIFWANVPIAVLAMVLVHVSVPGRDRSRAPEKIDLIGGVLLAVTLAAGVLGLYNPDPNGSHALPEWGVPVLIVALCFAGAFVVWEWRAKVKLIGAVPGQRVRAVPFGAAIIASACAGAALMVTLVDVELYAQVVLEQNRSHSTLMLLHFLVALPIGALIGGFLATKIGDRVLIVVGLAVASGGYILISRWPMHALSAHHDVVGLTLPVVGTDLAIAGFGLGLVVGPLTSAALRVVPSAQHGIASALVVVARMTGMLLGLSALTAWGMFRFNRILESLPQPAPTASISDMLAAAAHQYLVAYQRMYGEIFLVTAIVCAVGAIVGLFVMGRGPLDAGPSGSGTPPLEQDVLRQAAPD